MPSGDESLFDQVLNKNADVWTRIGQDAAGTEKGLWSLAQSPFNAIEQGVKLGFDPVAREKAWASAVQEANRLNKLAGAANNYAWEGVQNPAMVYRDARDSLQNFVTDQVEAESREGSKYWTDAAGDAVFGGVTTLAGGTAILSDKSAARAAENAFTEADKAVSPITNCPNAARDWSNIPGISWEGKVSRINSADYLDNSWDPRDSPYRYTGASENGLAGTYASMDLETPLAEVQPHFDKVIGQISGYEPIPPDAGMPKFESFAPVSKHVKLENYLDLSNESVRQSLNLSESDLVSDDHTLTRQIGAEAYMAGFDGIIAPSARRKGGINVISFGGL